MQKQLLFLFSLFAGLLAVQAQPFVQRQGKKLLFQEKEIYLRGIAFGNLVWEDAMQPQNHHTEQDFRRVRELGMNAVRFYLNYKTFEEDNAPFEYKASGWDWIDQNIAWAKKNGVFLILNMHIPQGGFQSQCNGGALWSIPQNQHRLVALWKAIADRYQNEPQIAGFDLLNEPIPLISTNDWTRLAQRIIDTIRTSDQHHLLISERANALNCNYTYNDGNSNYPQVKEDNLMYTVHLYDPYLYTHQLLDWAKTGDGGSYPDNSLPIFPSDASYATGNYSNPSIAANLTGWTYYEGTPFKVSHDSLFGGYVTLISDKTGTGKVYYDDFELKELDEAGHLIRTIYKINPTSASAYWWWSANKDGQYAEETTGHNDSYAISVTGTSSTASVTLPNLLFQAVKGRQYVVSGWMKGENLTTDARASITTEFFYSPSHSSPVVRNKAYLKEKITSYTRYIEKLGFPVFFGEFGAGRPCFANGKGGERWVADAMDIFDSLGYHFTYHDYKEPSFGLYSGWEQPVDTTTQNTALAKVFRDFYGKVPSALEEEQVADPTHFLFPNPATETIHTHGLVPKEVEVTDLTGTVLLRTGSMPVDVRQLPAGCYLLKIQTDDRMYYSRFQKR